MDQIDAKTFLLVMAGTVAAIEVLKAFLAKFISGKETALAIVLPVLFTVGAKLAGFFPATEWVDALLWAVGSGVGGGVAHDKLLDPAKNILAKLLPKKPPAS